jgi:hypothetical protein
MRWMWKPYGMAPEFTGTPTSAIFLLVFVRHTRNLTEKWPFNEKEPVN